MPIPNCEIDKKHIKLEIYEEVLRAKVNFNSRYSFLKRRVLEDLVIFVENSAVTVLVTCNGKSSAGHFVISDVLDDDALLGTSFLDEFEIKCKWY